MHEREMSGKLGGAFYERHDDVVVIPTLKCNLPCEICSYWCGEEHTKRVSEIGTKHLVQAIRELPRDIYLHIGGGEAAVNPRRLWRLIRAAQRLERFSLITNGLPFLTKKRTEHVIEEFPKHGLVLVSLDPAHAKEWGEERLKRIMGNIKRFKDNGGRVAFAVTSSPAEEKETAELLTLFKEQIGESAINPTPTRFVGRAEELDLGDIGPKTKSKQKAGGSYCFYIGPDGHLFEREEKFLGFIRAVRSGKGLESAGKEHAVGRLGGRESLGEIMARHLNVPEVKT